MEENDKIVFKHNGIELQYKVLHIGKYWLSNSIAGTNAAIFNLLKIKDRFAFCAKEVGYDFARKTSDFPELESLSDLEKVVNALYQRIIEISTPKFKVGDLVMVAKREGKSSDYPCSYANEMVQYENRIYTISAINKMSSSFMKNFTPKLRYEEPFYYELTGNTWNWSSAMLRKVTIIADGVKEITTPDEMVLADIGEINFNGISSYMDVHTPVITCDKAINSLSIYPEKEETEYKLNLNVKPLNFKV